MNIIDKIINYKKYRFLSKSIMRQIKISNGYGMVLSDSQIELEKSVMISIFIKFWGSIRNAKSDGDYNHVRRVVSGLIHEKLSQISIDQFNNTKSGSVRTIYSCHLDSCISYIFLNINNNLV